MIAASLALTAHAGAAGVDDDATDAEEEAAAEAEAAAGSAPADAGELDAGDAEEAPPAEPDGPDALDALNALGALDALDAPDGDALTDADALDADLLASTGAEAAASLAAPWSAPQGLASESSLAGALEPLDAEPRPPRPPRWGQLDVTVAWRRVYDATDQGSSRRDELWLLAIWRR